MPVPNVRRIVCRVLLLVLVLAGAAAAPAGAQEAALWRAIADGPNIAIQRQELDRIRQALPREKAPLDSALADVSSRLDQILLLRGVAGETPWASRSLLMQLKELTVAVDAACDSLRDRRDELARMKAEYAVLRQVRVQNASREYADLVSEELVGPGHDYKELKREVDTVKASVDAALAQGEALDAYIATARQEELERFVMLFRQVYFASSGSLLRLSGVRNLVDDFLQWRGVAPHFWEPLAGWTVWAWYLLTAAGYGALYGVALRLGRRRWAVLRERPVGPFLWFGAGVALGVSRHTVLFAGSQFTSLIWVAVGCWGLVGLLGGGGRLRILYACFTFLMVTDAANVPASVVGAVLPVLAAVATWRLPRSGGSGSCDVAVLASAGMAGLFGYGPQGASVVQALFMLHLAVGVTQAVQRRIGFGPEGAKRSLATRAAPLVATVMATGYVAWVLAFLGGPGLADYVFRLRFTLGRVAITLDAMAELLISFFLMRLLQAWFVRLLGLVSLRGRALDPALTHSIGALFSYVTWVLFLLFALHVFAVPLGARTWIASGLSVGIGFGLKDIVNNYVSGLIIMFGGAEKKGDIIQQGKNIGQVVDLSVRNTIMRTLDNTTVIIPNASFLRGEIANLSYQDATLRLTIPVTVAPGVKIKKVRKILMAIAREHPDVLKKPAPGVLLRAFGRLGLVFDLSVWIDDFLQKFQVQSELATAIDQQFQDNKILFAFQGVKFKDKPKGTEAMQLEAIRAELKEKRAIVLGKTRRLRRVHARLRWPVTPVVAGGEL